MFTTLIDADNLAAHLADPDWVIVDCRFRLEDTEFGRREYEAGHIPGSVYAHLDEVLSSPPVTDNGRHPLPPPEILIERMSRLGIDNNKQVVAYDDKNGMIASRLWWLLRYLGHEAAAVLDGGWPAWLEAGQPQRGGVEENAPRQFTGAPRTEWVVLAADVPDAALLVDSRGPERYSGEVETIDSVAGHIPGAVNYFYEQNWSENGRYLPPEQIRRQLQTVLAETDPDEAVFYCGSGVSACVNLLALTHAGLGNGRLYAGSWSDWITDPTRQIVNHKS
jgi:thiosulfate/3-mercaptopyruvate sulfurtransferase